MNEEQLKEIEYSMAYEEMSDWALDAMSRLLAEVRRLRAGYGVTDKPAFRREYVSPCEATGR